MNYKIHKYNCSWEQFKKMASTNDFNLDCINEGLNCEEKGEENYYEFLVITTKNEFIHFEHSKPTEFINDITPSFPYITHIIVAYSFMDHVIDIGEAFTYYFTIIKEDKNDSKFFKKKWFCIELALYVDALPDNFISLFQDGMFYHLDSEKDSNEIGVTNLHSRVRKKGGFNYKNKRYWLIEEL